MLVNRSETRNWTAISAVAVEGDKYEPVMYMNASYNDKDFNIQKSIKSMTLYLQNKTLVDNDFKAFEEDVTREISGEPKE